MEEFISNSQNETIEIAKRFSKTLKSGDIILLDGDLGAGKTVFAKGIVSALSNSTEVAVSPTFVIVNTYKCTPPVYHFDLYRINDVSELDAIGAEEYFYGGGICFVEWPERAEGYFLTDVISIEIKKLSDNERMIRIER